MRKSIWLVVLCLGFFACKEECEDLSVFTKCINNDSEEELSYKLNGTELSMLSAGQIFCSDLPEGRYDWEASNEEFIFSGDFDVIQCERVPDIIVGIEFLTTDFRDSLIGPYTFICKTYIEPQNPDTIAPDTIQGNVNIQDISRSIRILAVNADLVNVSKTGPDFSFTNIEANPTFSGSYNENTREMIFTRVLVNNLGENEVCACTGKKD